MAEWENIEGTWTAALADAFGCERQPRIEVREYSTGRWSLSILLSTGKIVMRSGLYPDAAAAQLAAVELAMEALRVQHRDELLRLSRDARSRGLRVA